MDDEASAPALAVSFSHVWVAEAVLDGMQPREAFDGACAQAFLWLLPLVILAARPRNVSEWVSAAALPEDGRYYPDSLLYVAGRKWTTRCFVRSAEQNQRVLAAGGGLPPMVPMPAAERQRLGWLVSMMRVYATGGGTLPEAARVTYDRHCGRPRRKRQPVGREWLAEQLSGGLDAAWAALRHLDGIPAQRPRLAQMDPAEFCQCGNPFQATGIGRAVHQASTGHEPVRR